MLTEQDLQETLAEAVDDPAAERLTLGLSDRALAEAGEGSWWRLGSWSGSRFAASRRVRWVSGIAVGSAVAVAAGVAMGGFGEGSGAGSSPAAITAPDMPANPVGQAALTAFAAECFDDHGPKLDQTYVWDPATQRYHGNGSALPIEFLPSPDGKRALVIQGDLEHAQLWSVADWPDAVAGRGSTHAVPDASGVRWTADGKEVVSQLAWDVVKATGGVTLRSRTAQFYDPASGRLLASVPIPQRALTMVAGRQWSIQEVQGDHDSALFPLLSADGSRLEYLNAQGTTVRTLTLQEGLSADVSDQSETTESARFSPDGRYLSEIAGPVLAVFDLQAGGKRIGWTDLTGHLWIGWVGADQIVTVDDKNEQLTGGRGEPFPLTGHSPVYSVLTPELKVVQQAKFVLPADPKGACATWPVSFAPRGQFPGAFVP